MQCQNQLKQLGLACHNYRDVHGGLIGSMPESDATPQKRLSLLVALLPYLEGDDLYRRIVLTQGWEAERNRDAIASPFKLYRCSSDHRTGPEFTNVTTYVGITGVGDDAASLEPNDPRAGVFGYDRKTKLKEIKDGESNTLLFLETTYDNGPWAAAGRSTLRGVDATDGTPFAKGGAFGQIHSASSWNLGGLKVTGIAALADGSARRLGPGISGEVLAALATIAGGERLPSDW